MLMVQINLMTSLSWLFTMSDRISKTLELKTCSGQCEKLYSFLAGCFDGLPVNGEFQSDLKLVAEEVLSNIMNYGLKAETDALISIVFSVDREKQSIHLTFDDTGIAFNPVKALVANVSADDLSDGGMGMVLINSLSDEQDYSRENGHNIFVVTKHYDTHN